jgi:dihydroorotate dehydrogenase
MFYSAVRRALFSLEPEKAHGVALAALARIDALGLTRWVAPSPARAPRRVMGIDFPNPVGLAAGFDKNAEYIDLMSTLGFGFIEVGTVTPRPQPGNPRPRVFRIPEREALINRLGFNNVGLDGLLKNIEHARFRGVLGINIGKNFDTPLALAQDDYLACLRRVYPQATYVAVNISSPNTPNLRELQNNAELERLLSALKEEQHKLAAIHRKHVPIAIKIAPDLSAVQVDEMATLLVKHEADGVIATNTTVSREGVEGFAAAAQAGGLSGAPLRERSTGVLRRLCAALDGRMPVIGVGGILSAQDALDKLDAGASLVQIYTGFIYRGPALVHEIVAMLRQRGQDASA